MIKLIGSSILKVYNPNYIFLHFWIEFSSSPAHVRTQWHRYRGEGGAGPHLGDTRNRCDTMGIASGITGVAMASPPILQGACAASPSHRLPSTKQGLPDIKKARPEVAAGYTWISRPPHSAGVLRTAGSRGWCTFPPMDTVPGLVPLPSILGLHSVLLSLSTT